MSQTNTCKRCGISIQQERTYCGRKCAIKGVGKMPFHQPAALTMAGRQQRAMRQALDEVHFPSKTI